MHQVKLSATDGWISFANRHSNMRFVKCRLVHVIEAGVINQFFSSLSYNLLVLIVIGDSLKKHFRLLTFS